MPRPPPPSQKGRTPWNKGKKVPRVALYKARRERLARLLARAAANPPGPHPRVQLALSNPYDVRVGQRWRNVDPRAGSNPKAGAPAVQVVKVQPPYAFCYVLDGAGNLALGSPVTKLRLDLFREREPRATRWGGGGRGWRLMP